MRETVTEPRPTRSTRRDRSLGQSVVELALLLPVLLLILMLGLDLGRVYLGWVNLNNTARIAANYAATNATQMAAGNPAAKDTYYQLISDDAEAINCTLPPKASFPQPTYPGGTGLGQTTHVVIECQFGILTPIISNVLGNPITVSASSDFPIRTGIIAGNPTGGGSTVNAAFNYSPAGGPIGTTVSFTDFSSGSPTSWEWDFNGDGVIDSTSQTGNTFTYNLAGAYDAKLTVSNGLSTSWIVHTITINPPPGPVVAFTFDPPTGTVPLAVNFTNTSTGTNPLTYLWNFGDGTPTSTAKNPSHTFTSAGTWTVTLTVTDKNGLSNSGTATVPVSAAAPQCTVPDFKNVMTSDAIQTTWTTAGFNTTVIFNPSRPPEYKIKKQNLAAGTQKPCSGTVITVEK